jgi:BNR repeat-containing family member
VIRWSDDDGATWSSPKTVLHVASKRPYWNVYDNGTDRIDVICTDGGGGGSELNNTSLFHFYIQDDNIYATDGTFIQTIASLTSSGVDYAALTKVYDYATAGAAWGWDVARHPTTGRPACVFSVALSGASPANSDHRYWYASWDDTAWNAGEFVAGGSWIDTVDTEPRYSGGLNLDKSDPSNVFISRQRTGTAATGDGTWEVEKWTTPDAGLTWTYQMLTQGGTEKNLRPVCPRNRPGRGPEVVYMGGRYSSFVSYDTRLNFWPTRLAQPKLARVKVPSLDSSPIYMYYGNGDAADASASPFDANVVARYASLNRYFSGAGGSTAPDFATKEAVDLHGLAGLTVSVRVNAPNYVGSGSLLDYIAGDWDGLNTKASFLLRIKRQTGSAEAFVIREANTSIGGGFTSPGGINLLDGDDHSIVLTFDTTNGLQMWVDGTKSVTTYATSAALDVTAAATLLYIGSSAHVETAPTNRARGRIEDLVVANVKRPDEYAVALGHDRVDIAAVGVEQAVESVAVRA